MIKLLAVVIGALFGGAVGGLRYYVQWHKPLKYGKKLSKGALYLRMVLNYVWDIGSLSILYLLRHDYPFGLDQYWTQVMIGAALTMALVIQIIPLKTVYGNKNGEDDC